MPDFSKRIVYRIDGMEHARVTRALPFKEGSGRALQMDLYAPRAGARAPAVLLVHGGPLPIDAPSPRSWGIFQSYGELLAASGLVAVVFEHRLHAPTDFPQSQQDIAAAVEHLRANADTYGVDPDLIGLWLFSGAGPQLSWALRERSPYVRCAAVFYGLLDLEHVTPPDADATTIAAVQALCPRTYLRPEAPPLPMFIARAGRDSALVNTGLDRFVAAAIANNAPLHFVNHPQGEHSFDVLTDTNDSRAIIRAAIHFFQRQLRTVEQLPRAERNEDL